jgi:hypothetical protein
MDGFTAFVFHYPFPKQFLTNNLRRLKFTIYSSVILQTTEK